MHTPKDHDKVWFERLRVSIYLCILSSKAIYTSNGEIQGSYREWAVCGTG